LQAINTAAAMIGFCGVALSVVEKKGPADVYLKALKVQEG
jgi:hypothetical protein